MKRARLAALAAVIAASGALLAACPKPNGYQAVRVFPAVGFAQMTGAFAVPGAGNFALVLTKPGVIYRADLDDPTGATAPFMDISSRVIANPGMEEGLLGLAFAPDYATSGVFYLNYVAGNPRRTVVSRFVAGGATADPATERVILQIPQPFSNHKGGSMAFGPDGDLYIGVGDGGSEGDPQGNGQDVHTLLGKILRIDVSASGYTIPASNPFARGGGRPEIYAWGLRNPWRISFDSATDQLWAGDVGQNQWEEVDRVEKGRNYGWNTMEGYACYHPVSGCDTSGLTPPRAVYGHDAGCAVIGGYVYRGAAMPELAGWYVYGDFCSGRVWAVHTGDTSSQPIQLMDSGLPIAAFLQGKDGDLYLVTFAGGIYQIVRKT